MSTSKENAWNFTSLFLFFGLVLLTGYGMEMNDLDIREITLTDLIILMLAVYRVTRVVVFEKIFKFFRDFVKNNSGSYVMRTLCSIITCPWCAGVWISLVMVIFFYFIPFGQLLVYIMAISGVASFLVLLSNSLNLDIKKKQKDNRKEE
ncbi:MAG: DUF1360 domain-containing protein [Bacteroidota bacterium]